jgi:hypothetical protein
MNRTWKRMALVVMPAIVVAIVAAADVQADPIPTLTVTNGEFTQYMGPGAPGGNDSFNNVNPTGWTSGSAGPGGSLIYVTNTAAVNNYAGSGLPIYGPKQGAGLSASNPFPAPPLPGNFVEADGNPYYGNSFSYQLSGLTVGQTYQLSFLEAFGQELGFGNTSTTTSNQWVVGLGVMGSQFVFNESNPNQYSYTYSDPNGSVTTPGVVTVPGQGVSPWQQVTVTLVADATNDVLTFLAWGNQGSTANVPPIAFLDIGANGNAVATSPEPASLSLMVIGMLGFGAYRLRRRRSNPATV